MVRNRLKNIDGRRRKSGFGVSLFFWILTGILVCMSAAAMWAGGGGNLSRFYNVGEVYDVYGSVLELPGENVVFEDEKSILFTVSSEVASKEIPVKENIWGFMYVDLTTADGLPMNWHIVCEDSSGTVTADFEYEAMEGKNLISLGFVKISKVMIHIDNQIGSEFFLNSIQFREDDKLITWEKCGWIIILTAFIYVLLSVSVFFIFRKSKNLSGMTVKMTDVYLRLLEKLAGLLRRLFDGIPDSVCRPGRILCFLILIFYAAVALNMEVWATGYLQSTLIYSILLLLISIFSLEKVERAVKWNRDMIRVWLLFWILVCVSDFIVGKVYAFLGYVFLLLFGLLFYVWGQMQNRKELLLDFICAVQFSFIITVLFCVICRPEIEGTRYMGIFTNPNCFANYLVPVWVSCLTLLDRMLDEKQPWWKYLSISLEIIFIVFFLWKTQSRGALIAFGGVGAAFLIRLFIKRRDPVSALKRLFPVLILTMGLLNPVTLITEQAINTIPVKLGTAVILEKDAVKPTVTGNLLDGLFPQEVYASESRVAASLRSRSLDQMTSGRITYWKAYVRDMNLWGHRYKASVNGVKHDPHNMLLGIAYRYGVPVGVFYLYLWITVIRFQWNKLFGKRGGDLGLLPFLASVGFLLLAAVDSLEQPWIFTLWFMAYLMIGNCFYFDGSPERYNEER